MYRYKISLSAFLSLFIMHQAIAENFTGRVIPFPKPLQTEMLASIQVNHCPINIDQLRYLTVSYWGFDNQSHQGEIILNKAIASDSIILFKELYKAKYHINAIAPYNTNYGKNNITVGFYCDNQHRNDDEAKSHMLGLAIDINPLNNPVIRKNSFWPENATLYTNRAQDLPGMVRPHHKTFIIFTKHNWTWGGLWQTYPNYMHFQKTK